MCDLSVHINHNAYLGFIHHIAMSANTIVVVCTLDTCPISMNIIRYQPNLPGNVFFATIFGLILFAHVGFGIWYKTWSFLIVMVCGLTLEIVGYVGRILLHNDPSSFTYFVL